MKVFQVYAMKTRAFRTGFGGEGREFWWQGFVGSTPWTHPGQISDIRCHLYVMSLIWPLKIGQISDMSGRMSDISGQISDINGRISDISGHISDIGGHISDINGRISDIIWGCHLYGQSKMAILVISHSIWIFFLWYHLYGHWCQLFGHWYHLSGHWYHLFGHSCHLSGQFWVAI